VNVGDADGPLLCVGAGDTVGANDHGLSVQNGPESSRL